MTESVDVADFASAAGPVVYSLTVGTAIWHSTIVVASPAESLSFGRLAGIGTPPAHDPPARRRILARELGIHGDFGPRTDIAPTTGDCLAPIIPAGTPLLIDPDQTPRPGEIAIIRPRTADFLAVGEPPVMLSHDELDDVDEHDGPIASPGGWCFAKILAAPLPPRDQWADDRDHRLVVRMTNPDVELRANLCDALVVDRVLGPVRLPGMPPHVAAAIDGWEARA